MYQTFEFKRLVALKSQCPVDDCKGVANLMWRLRSKIRGIIETNLTVNRRKRNGEKGKKEHLFVNVLPPQSAQGKPREISITITMPENPACRQDLYEREGRIKKLLGEVFKQEGYTLKDCWVFLM